jgi:hypothetical protein
MIYKRAVFQPAVAAAARLEQKQSSSLPAQPAGIEYTNCDTIFSSACDAYTAFAFDATTQRIACAVFVFFLFFL